MIMASSATPKHISITLVVDKNKNKVLYAEAESDFVDILLSFLSLPLGTVSELISKDSTAKPCRFNCITSLYQSVKNLDPKYFYSNEYKGKLLNPTNPMEAYSEKLVYNFDDTPISKGFHGYLHKPASFIVSDDLLALASDLDTTWWILQNFGIDFDSERLTVNVNQNEVLDLLKFSLWSETPLTDLFLRKKLPIRISQIPESELEVNEIKGKEGRKMNLRLMVLKSPRKALFAEAGKDFTDQLLSFLTIPLGALEHLAQGKFGLGCIDNLYKSLRRLDPARDFSSEFYNLKNELLNPHVALSNVESQLLPIYRPDLPSEIRHDGYTRWRSLFLVADNLSLVPFSQQAALAILRKSKVEVDDLLAVKISVGLNEVLDMLRAAILTSSALTLSLNLTLPCDEEETCEDDEETCQEYEEETCEDDEEETCE